MSANKIKHKWILYKWKLKLKGGGTNNFNMPHLIGGKMEEPTEEQVMGFVNNFQTSIRDQVESCSWEFIMEYED